MPLHLHDAPAPSCAILFPPRLKRCRSSEEIPVVPERSPFLPSEQLMNFRRPRRSRRTNRRPKKALAHLFSRLPEVERRPRKLGLPPRTYPLDLQAQNLRRLNL